MNAQKIHSYAFMDAVGIQKAHMYVNAKEDFHIHRMEDIALMITNVQATKGRVEKMEDVSTPRDHSDVFVILDLKYLWIKKVALT